MHIKRLPLTLSVLLLIPLILGTCSLGLDINTLWEKVRKETSIKIEMAWIPAGTFTMGSPESEPFRDSGEIQHEVILTSGFYIGKYQITQAQYKDVMKTNPSNFITSSGGTNPANHPVETVSWYDAIVFCNTLSIAEGLSPAYCINESTNPDDWGSIPTYSNTLWNSVNIADGSNGYRLPTEAQWEYTCRSGTTTAYNTGTIINDTTGWYNTNSEIKTHEVGLKPANYWGLYDMHGNVWEWCWDWYGAYSGEAQTDPMGSPSGANRVIRGGSWGHSAQYIRSAYRYYNTPSNRINNLGFRIVRF